MELESEQKIVRIAMIVVIAVGMSWIGMWTLAAGPDAENNIPDVEIAYSGFGQIKLNNPEKINLFPSNIYQNDNLGFQISKPNSDWEIHSVLDEINSDELTSLRTKGFLDGVYVEQNHDRKFMLTVFDVKKEKFSLHEYVDGQIILMESQKNITIPFEQVSPANDWAIFAMEMSDSKQYGEQLLFLKDSRLYMLQYSGGSPKSLDSKQKNDFQFIMDSFEVI